MDQPGKALKLGGWLAIPEPLVVEAAATAGFDWVGLDLQHGGWDLGTAFRAIQLIDALRIPSVVRVSEDDLAQVPRVLDHGASGVVVAMVSSPEVAADAVDRARYQPKGRRSFGGQRYGMHSKQRSPEEVQPAIYAMIEDRRGYEAVEEIAAVPGLGGLHVGPVDLGLGLGIGTDWSVPAFTSALETIVVAGRKAGIPVIMHAIRGEDAGKMQALGFDELVLTADIEALRDAFAGHVRAARAAIVT